ncbi:MULTISPECIES: zf-HC2 domain-containing protein [unclassified Amycolatopsis]|uniref:zf-HC2 domain-containing protein n=1 Tax=unclassified Amycolatopsis TaxID=2618356 RepID=UPI001C69DCB9|nr:zf-HC2 domain-containing protein [Amycolatopsis sp. DSM 110486]QYN25201.1 zf-HC2 domain-containing protein [Amycolatopsis sp. DSM 110486]
MTAARGWGLPESHLLPDVVVALVDGELSLGAQDRASAHIARCPGCAAEVAAQRQAVAAVKCAGEPSMSAGFLASLRSIPDHTELPGTPDNLAMTADGQLVAIQRPDRVAGLRDAGVLGGTAPLGSSTPLGHSSHVLGGGRFTLTRKRAAQGAGVVVSGLVLSALALVGTTADSGEGAPDTGGVPQPNANLLPAQMAVPRSEPTLPPPSSTLPTATSVVDRLTPVPAR